MKLVLFLVLLCLAFSSFAQTKTKTGLSHHDYLQKSKRKKTTAWILVGSGAALVTTGLLIPEGEVNGFSVYPDWSETHENDNVKAALSLTGVFSIIASIPFFISASKNRSKAGSSLSLSNQLIQLPRQHNFVSATVPCLTLKIGL